MVSKFVFGLLHSSSFSFPQTGNDSFRVAVRPTSLSDWRRGGGRGFSAACRSAAEPHCPEDAESSGVTGGDETAGLLPLSLIDFLIDRFLSQETLFVLKLHLLFLTTGKTGDNKDVLWLAGVAESQSRARTRRQLPLPEGHRLPSTPSPQGLRVSSLQVSSITFSNLSYCHPPTLCTLLPKSVQ